MTAYIMKVVSVFGQEACERARADHQLPPFGRPPWDVQRIESETKNFVKCFAVEAFREKRAGNILGVDGEIEEGLWLDLMRTPQWRAFQEQKLLIAELQAKPETAPLITLPDFSPSKYKGFSLVADIATGLPKPKSETAREIEKLMNECRFTQQELAKAIGLPVSTIWRHVNDKMKPGVKVLREYEQAFSKRLSRQIVIPRNATKRNKKQ